MPFNLEQEMIPIIKSHIELILSNHITESMAIAEELPVNYRIVDLAFASINHECIGVVEDLALRKAFNKLNMMELDVLSVFFSKNEQISIQKLTKMLKLNPERIRQQYLDKFLDIGLIQKVTRYSYKASEWAKVHPTCVVAIEAKLKKWQEALNQAKDNLKFADFSYVALDENTKIKPDLVNKFIESNIGLISVSDNGTITMIYQPKKNRRYEASDFRLQRLRLCRDLICQNSKWSLICQKINTFGGKDE